MFSTDALIWQALLAMQRHPWEQGVASHAALDAGRDDVAVLLAHDAMVRQDAEGRLGATESAGLVNSGACGEAVALLVRAGVAGAAEALERQRWWILRDCPRADSGVLYHLDGVPEVWVDTIYMVVPFLVATGDFAPADMQYRMHRQHLWNPSTGLYGHRYNVELKTAVRDAPWASGNGWVVAGIARALRVGGEGVPAQMRERWRDETQELLTRCAEHERPDGRFHDVLTDDSTFVDGAAGLMLSYAAFTGVADGWLDPAWLPRAERWLTAALDRVDAIGLVREVCGSPHFDRQGTSAEAQAFALMARSAHQRSMA
ncbi:MAG: glycosyl hydrolase family 88 [Actinobacteria bacterium HGW-Actinobacteria-4]|nr:MAG: glycosyl hydrolase family 88 [Actinobacteria bacterium HGW-Actinobacteria-4]